MPVLPPGCGSSSGAREARRAHHAADLIGGGQQRRQPERHFALGRTDGLELGPLWARLAPWALRAAIDPLSKLPKRAAREHYAGVLGLPRFTLRRRRDALGVPGGTTGRIGPRLDGLPRRSIDESAACEYPCPPRYRSTIVAITDRPPAITGGQSGPQRPRTRLGTKPPAGGRRGDPDSALGLVR